jgi:hypothetical protein
LANTFYVAYSVIVFAAAALRVALVQELSRYFAGIKLKRDDPAPL